MKRTRWDRDPLGRGLFRDLLNGSPVVGVSFHRRRLDMKRFTVLTLVSLALAASVCLAQDVRYNFDKSADFSKFKTYKWVPIKDAAKVSDLVDKQIKDALDTELTTKGLTKVDGDE